MPSISTSCNSGMLTFAREEIGYTIEQAAEAIGISVENLEAVESGNRPITLNQLRKAAKKYSFPLGFFYFSSPPFPKSFEPLPDFRIEPELDSSNNYRLNLEIKKSREKREIYIDLAASLQIEDNPFHLLDEPYPTNIGSLIRERLGVTDSAINSLNYDQVYPYWKNKIEGDGVLVHESQYIPDVSGVIGAAIYYETYPIILIKRGNGFNERKLFTLLHEYSHLLKGRSAINDTIAQIINLENSSELQINVGSSTAQLEASCNQMAAEILVPSEKIIEDNYLDLDVVERMEVLAKQFKVTHSTAAMCLKRLNFINRSELTFLLDLRRKASENKRPKKGKELRIPRENIVRLDMGSLMFNKVLEAYSGGLLDVFDASRILNLRVKKIDRLVSGIR